MIVLGDCRFWVLQQGLHQCTHKVLGAAARFFFFKKKKSGTRFSGVSLLSKLKLS
jgi:hypothetical protein